MVKKTANIKYYVYTIKGVIMLTILCMYSICICEVELAIFNILKFGTHFPFCNSSDKFAVQNN